MRPFVVPSCLLWFLAEWMSIRRGCQPRVLSIRALADDGHETLHRLVADKEGMRTAWLARFKSRDFVQGFILAGMVREVYIHTGFCDDVLKPPGRCRIRFERLRRPLEIETHTAPHGGEVPLGPVLHWKNQRNRTRSVAWRHI